MKGVLVKDYKIIEAIGEGGMATVYLAEHQLLGHKVAVKILNEELAGNKNIRSRFIAEAKNMARMSHPNIIKVIDLVDDVDLVAFVMEYMEGQTLKEHLNVNRSLTGDEIKKLFVQMLDAVGYVHEQRLVHRDIKPGNFMISVNGVVKLLDFGIAKNTDVNSSEYTMTGTNQNMGTPMYMSPEQVKSTKEVTHQSDIYSLGVVLWQMLTGRKPYDSKELSVPEIQVSILKEELPLTNTSWDAIIKRAMHKSVDLRYYHCVLMKEDIEHLNLLTEKDSDNKTIIENIHEKGILKNSILSSTESLYDDIIIRMPLLSDTMTEGKIVKWNKKVGDYVKSDDVLADVETDKATMEIIGYAEGTLLYIGVKDGDSAKVNDTIAIIRKKQYSPPLVLNDSLKDVEIIRMPLLSDTMTDGKIVKWNKKVGDYVTSDDVLADVETDKATMEVVGYSEGILLQRGAEEGEFLKVNEIIAVIKKNTRLTTSNNRLIDANLPLFKNEYIEKLHEQGKYNFEQTIHEKTSLSRPLMNGANVQAVKPSFTEQFGFFIARYFWYILGLLIVILSIILGVF